MRAYACVSFSSPVSSLSPCLPPALFLCLPAFPSFLFLLLSLCVSVSLCPRPPTLAQCRHSPLSLGLQPEAGGRGGGEDALLVPAPQGHQVGVSVPEQPPGRRVKTLPAETAPTLPVFPAQPHPGPGCPLPGTHPLWVEWGYWKVRPNQECPGKWKPKQDQVAWAVHADQAQARSCTAPCTQGETEAQRGRRVTQLVRVRIPSLDSRRDSDRTKGILPAPPRRPPWPISCVSFQKCPFVSLYLFFYECFNTSREMARALICTCLFTPPYLEILSYQDLLPYFWVLQGVDQPQHTQPAPPMHTPVVSSLCFRETVTAAPSPTAHTCMHMHTSGC